MKTKYPFLVTLYLLLSFTSASVDAQEFDGYALYNSLNNNTTYLIDANENIAHTWSLPRPCNYAVLLMPTGNIMRGYVNQGNAINGPAVGGGVQEIDPQGNIIWQFVYSSSDHVAHHDITLMPDGNVLLTAWETYTNTELTALGFTGNSNQKFPTHFIEVSQNGTGGEIVWEWHMIDHMIQDVDPNLPNFGVVSDHPERMNINVATSGGGGGPFGGSGDWFHVNGVDYNEDLDLICFSSRYLSEIFIIDHSVSSEEAKGSTGGNYGKGGDLLYRWGNPSNYNTPGTKFIGGPVHDARFITDDGRPRGGFLQFFNNTAIGNQSTVDAIELPYTVDGLGFVKLPGEAYGPTEINYRHMCLSNADGQSASNSLPNGNTYVNLSGGFMYEVDINGNVVWQYPEGPAKGFRYTCDDPGIEVLSNTGVIEDLCMYSSLSETDKSIYSISPNPSNGLINVSGLEAGEQVVSIIVFDPSLRKICTEYNSETIDLSEFTPGIYFMTIALNNGFSFTRKINLL